MMYWTSLLKAPKFIAFESSFAGAHNFPLPLPLPLPSIVAVAVAEGFQRIPSLYRRAGLRARSAEAIGDADADGNGRRQRQRETATATATGDGNGNDYGTTSLKGSTLVGLGQSGGGSDSGTCESYSWWPGNGLTNCTPIVELSCSDAQAILAQ